MKTAVVIGSTGLIGQQLVQRLAADPTWSSVLAISRGSPVWEHPKIRNIRFDFQSWGELEMQIRAFSGPNSLDTFCCLGTTMAKAGSESAFRKVDYEAVVGFATLAQRLHADSLFVVSALGADAQSSIFYNRVKGEAENKTAQIFTSGKLHFLRPSLLLGDREEFRLGERVAILLSPLLSLFLIGPLKKYKPISSGKIADIMVRLASKQATGPTYIENASLLNDF